MEGAVIEIAGAHSVMLDCPFFRHALPPLCTYALGLMSSPLRGCRDTPSRAVTAKHAPSLHPRAELDQLPAAALLARVHDAAEVQHRAACQRRDVQGHFALRLHPLESRPVDEGVGEAAGVIGQAAAIGGVVDAGAFRKHAARLAERACRQRV